MVNNFYDRKRVHEITVERVFNPLIYTHSGKKPRRQGTQLKREERGYEVTELRKSKYYSEL